MSVLRDALRLGAPGAALRRVVTRLAPFLTGCLLLSQAAFGGLYCNDPTLEIPQPGSVSDDMIIEDHQAIYDLNVKIVATHSYVGDLTFTLQKVAGDGAAITEVQLLSSPGNGICSDDNVDVVLDDEADNGPIASQCDSPLGVNGPYTPNSPLSVFDGLDIAGTWRLTVYDSYEEDGGRLNEWCLITQSVLDVDGDGEITALTDALLILRHGFGFTGSVLVNGAVDLANCTRCDAMDIQDYLDDLP